MLAACDNNVDEPTSSAWDGQASDTGWYSADETSFSIGTPAQLAGLAELVNSDYDFAGKTVTLTADIDLGGHEWTPIGRLGTVSIEAGTTGTSSFKGTFDGGGNKISGLVVTNARLAGLFGAVNGGTVTDLVIDGASVSTTRHGGIVVGQMEDGASVTFVTISNSSVTGGDEADMGAVTGRLYNGGTIDNCKNENTSVTLSTEGETEGCNVGGIAESVTYDPTLVDGQKYEVTNNSVTLTGEAKLDLDYGTLTAGVNLPCAGLVGTFGGNLGTSYLTFSANSVTIDSANQVADGEGMAFVAYSQEGYWDGTNTITCCGETKTEGDEGRTRYDNLNTIFVTGSSE